MAVTEKALIEATMKEGWTQDNLEVQFMKDDPLLETLGVTSPDRMIGKYAITGVHTGRGGGISKVPESGSNELNKAAAEQTAQAKWKLRRTWDVIEIDTLAIKETQNSSQAVTSVVDLEVEAKVSNVRKQLTSEIFRDQTGLICGLKANEETKTLKLAITGEYGLGKEATRQQWLAEGQEIDIGTTAEEAVIGDGRVITAINDSETEPTITISGANVTTTTSHYVSIKNGRSGTTSYDMNGLRNIASQTTVLGELNPETETGWKGSFLDTEGGALSRQRVIQGRRKGSQRGNIPDFAVTSLKQVENLENETYPMTRFDSTGAQNLSDGTHVMIGNLKVQAHEDCPDGDFTYLIKKNISMLRDEKPYWVSDRHGSGILEYKQGTTYLYGALEWFSELYTNKRRTVGQFRGLS